MSDINLIEAHKKKIFKKIWYDYSRCNNHNWEQCVWEYTIELDEEEFYELCNDILSLIK